MQGCVRLCPSQNSYLQRKHFLRMLCMNIVTLYYITEKGGKLVTKPLEQCRVAVIKTNRVASNKCYTTTSTLHCSLYDIIKRYLLCNYTLSCAVLFDNTCTKWLLGSLFSRTIGFLNGSNFTIIHCFFYNLIESQQCNTLLISLMRFIAHSNEDG